MTPTRWAAVLCLLSCAASAQGRLDRLQRRLDRRDRLGGTGASGPLLSMALTGDCEGTTPSGLTFTRNTGAQCRKADGTFVTLGNNVPPLESGGLLFERGTTNLLLQGAALTTAPWATAFGGGVVAAPTLTAQGGGVWRLDFSAVSGAGSFQVLQQSIGARTTATHAVAFEVQAVSGTAATYLSLWDGASDYRTAPCLAVAGRWTSCSVDAQALTTSSWTVVLGTDLRDSQQAATSAASLLVRFPQAEALAAPTRYVPTVAATASRFNAGASWAWPVVGDTWCITVRDVAPSSDFWLQPTGNRYLAQVGTTSAANSAALYLAGGTLTFGVYDGAGVAKFLAGGSPISLSAHTVTACNASGALSLYVEGWAPEFTSPSGTGTGTWSATPTVFRIGSTSSSSSEMGGWFGGVCVSGATRACGEGVPVASAHTCASCIATQQVAMVGDSITQGVNASAMPYPRWLSKLLGPDWGVDNFGYSGTRADQMLPRWRNRIRGQGWGTLVMLGGINDIHNTARTSDAIWADIQAIYEEARADGLRVVPVTILPAGSVAGWTAAKQTRLDAVNASILAYCTTWGLTCVDAYAAMGEPGTPTQLATVYNSGDGLHPNVAGHKALAALVKAALLP